MSSAAAAMEGSVQELREVNRLMYLRPDNASLVDKRTMKSYNFSSSGYSPGQTAQSILNCGGDAIWGPTSYIKFTFTKTDQTIGTGSVLNFIKSVRLTHRSGEVLEYIQNYNVIGKLILYYALDGDGSQKAASLLDVPDAAGTYTRCIPLWMLLGVFNEQSQYIPPGMLAGAKLEIELESNAIAFSGQGDGAGLTDVNMNVVLDSAQIYDSVQKQLMDEQADVAKSGLQFSYSTWFASSGLFAGSSLSFDVQQSASITQVACAVLRATASLVGNQDSFAYKDDFTKVQWRLGSQYFPQQALQLDAGQVEAYLTTLVAWEGAPNQFAGMTASGKGSAATLADFVGGQAHGHYAQTMEKSSTGLQLTGEPTNNSRILNLEAEKPAVGDRVDVFLRYLRVANLMGDNIVVDR